MDQQHLKQIAHYCPETGLFHWLNSMAPNAQAGSTAGHLGNGYRYICINGKRYKSARLAFLYMTGRWPEGYVDHINRVKTDDRWSNLREASPAENGANRKPWGTSCFKGVEKLPGGNYSARFKGKRLGTFKTPEEASKSYYRAATEAFGDFVTI